MITSASVAEPAALFTDTYPLSQFGTADSRNGSRIDHSYEIVNGTVVEVPPMSARSHRIGGKLTIHLGGFVETKGLGRVLSRTPFILDFPARRFQREPDVAYLSAERWPLEQPDPSPGEYPIAPDLAVEVSSPHDKYDDILVKIEEYFRFGVRQVWQIAATSNVVHIFTGFDQVRVVPPHGILTAEDLFPGWSLPLTDLFPPMPAA